MPTPTLLLLGRHGQLGHALAPQLAQLGRVIAPLRTEFDLTDAAQLTATVAQLRPAVIVNAAAYTAVDRAEHDAAAAFATNATGPATLARLAASHGSALVHYSTDYVFDGQRHTPYPETAPTAPRSVYGQSKLAGEQAVRAATPQHLILRTSWVYGVHGHNFLKTVLGLLQQRPSLRIVADQIGAPTSAQRIASVTVRLLRQWLATNPQAGDHDPFPWGTYHLSASGSTSWHGYAQTIARQAQALGLPLRASPDDIQAITTPEYPLPAPRPAYAVLDTQRLCHTFGLTLPPWEQDLQPVLHDLLCPPTP